ncbi:hypothetical protein [Nostoc sp. ChiQUE01b]|uniref:hypothetical protein n=1 Tax=Nostoc sp. ChiQUE01b TaxID=3075376 RepID=UPI002AD3AEE3|nr:hypothetical protein [Nostoc sp. ChiQUE01b]MDZ8257637.1 hypothetical protein [Nostoc sp. ChiQUE01b]
MRWGKSTVEGRTVHHVPSSQQALPEHGPIQVPWRLSGSGDTCFAQVSHCPTTIKHRTYAVGTRKVSNANLKSLESGHDKPNDPSRLPDKIIEETADMWAFAAHWTGLDVR